MRVPGAAVLLCLVMGGLSAAAPVEAQRPQPTMRGRLLVRPGPEIGVRGGFEFDAEEVSAGFQARVPVGPFLEVAPSGDLYLGGAQADWQLNVDVAVRTGFRQTLYAGTGGALARRAFEVQGTAVFPAETRVGINLFVGVSTPRFLRTPVRAYAEARWTFVSEFDAQFGLVGGVNLPLGPR